MSFAYGLLNFKPLESPDMVVTVDTVPMHAKVGDFYLKRHKDPKQGQSCLEQAIDAYTCDVEINDNPDTLAQLAKVYGLSGRLDSAAYYAQKTLNHSHAGKDACKKAYEVQAFVYARHENYPAAQTALKKALRLEKPWRAATLNLALSGLLFNQLSKRFNVTAGMAMLFHLVLGLTFLPFCNISPRVLPTLKLFGTKIGNLFRNDQQAMTALFNLYRHYPGLESLMLEIGMMYQHQNMTAEAEFWFQRAQQRYPVQEDAYRYLVNLYQKNQSVEQGVQILRQWLKIRPNSGRLNMVLSHALASSENAEQLASALFYARQGLLYLKSREDQAEGYCHLGALYRACQNTEAAITAYQAALSANPAHPDAIIQLGTLYFDREDFALSQQVFEKAVTLMPRNARIFCNLGYLAWIQNNITQALDYYQRSVSLDPSYDIALNNLGVLYLDHIGDMTTALMLFDQSLASNPDYALCHYNKGRAHSFLGNSVDAAQCFIRAQSLNGPLQELDSRELDERIQQLFDLNRDGF